MLLSLKIATVNACFATILGTLAGLALVRFGRFKGRTVFSGMISAPLVMPEVITGLSLLLMFITLKEFFGWPDKRGFSTITIAHITFSMAYVAVIIQSRLAGMAQDLEEAAQDLGAKPFRVLTDITFTITGTWNVGWLVAVFHAIAGRFDNCELCFWTRFSDITDVDLFTRTPWLETRISMRWQRLLFLLLRLGVLLAAWIMFRQQKQREMELKMSEED